MGENIAQRKTNTINIVAYGIAGIEKLADKTEKGINPDGKDAREFAFTKADANAAIPPKTHKNHQIFLIAESKEGEFTALRKALIKKDRPFLYLQGSPDTILKAVKDTLLDMEKALDMGFTLKDFAQMHNRGISIEKIRKQLVIFRNGISKLLLRKPATLNDGIFPLPAEKAEEYAAFFDREKNNYTIKKFVPASGAATRMFKALCDFLAEFDPDKETINNYINRKKGNAMSIFMVGLDKFPFYGEVLAALKENPDYSSWNKDRRVYNFIKTMLTDGQFNYANKPKGILPFHQYDNFIATPVYEHLMESAAYAETGGKAHVHFTISEEHLDGFLDSIREVKEGIEKETGVAISFSFSYQHTETDTLAVEMDNRPFRDADGNLVFRPGGHGALIENLKDIEADIVFVKNIDNVSHNNIHTIALYKKALAGKLMTLQKKIFGYLEKLERHEVTESNICELFDFAAKELAMDVPKDIKKYTFEHKKEYAFELLNRPIRVCGMVKNEGEPGGGPFWVEGEKGRLSLQIVESSQMDLEDKSQKALLARATHFNPVDLVCGLKDYKGNYFDLTKYIDSSTGFIVYKNRMGKDVKSYELPGLWNGAMAGWITVFTEVPLETFNPVKTVNDLLKPAHQPL